MTQLVRDVPDFVFTVLSGAANVSLLFGLLYLLKCVFELDFTCLCEPQTKIECTFLICPVMMLSMVVCLSKSETHRTDLTRKFWHFITTIPASCVFWWSAVLLDGDFWPCFITRFTEHRNISCKNTSELTSEERIILAGYRNDSVSYGLLAVTGSLLLWWFIPGLSQCCKTKNCYLPNYKKFYDASLKEAMEKHLKDELIKIAQMKAESLCSKYIENIKKDQGLQFRNIEDNEETGGIEDTWKKISSSDLFEDKTNSPEKAWLVWFSVKEKLEILKSRINERAKSSVAETKDQMLQNLDEHLHEIDKDKVGAARGSLKDEQGGTASAESLAVGVASTSRQVTVSTQGDSTNQAGGYSSCERMETASGGGNSGAESLPQADEANETTSLLCKSKKKTRY